MAFEIFEPGESGTVIKVVGVGGAGGNALNNMVERTVQGDVEFIAVNTDRQALSQTKATKTIQLGTSGLGAGARPEVGAAAADQSREEIAEALRGANMVFITAGMGGGTGTGASPVIAEVSQQLGILTVAVVTKPFSFEGGRRMKNAERGLQALKNRVHSMIVILNDKLEDELGEDATMLECFEKADEVLYNACSGIAEIICAPGLINVDFKDVCTVMSERGTALMGAAEAEGPDRAITAASKAIECPLLEGVELKEARGLLVNITANRSLKMSETREAMSTIRNCTRQDANIVLGAVLDESMGDKIRVTVIATGLDPSETDDTFVKTTGSDEGGDVWGGPQTGKPEIWNPVGDKPQSAEIPNIFGSTTPAKAASPEQPKKSDVSSIQEIVSKPTQQAAPAPQQKQPEPVQKPAAVQPQKPSANNVFDNLFGNGGRPISAPDNPFQNGNPFASGIPSPKPSQKTPEEIFSTLGGHQMNAPTGTSFWSTESKPANVAEESAPAEAEPLKTPAAAEKDYFKIPDFLKSHH